MTKIKNFAIFFILPVLTLYALWRVATSNERVVFIEDCQNADKVALSRLNEHVEGSFSNRETYEVFVKCADSPYCVAHYNVKYEVLWIEVDPGSGWMPPLKVSRERLKQMAGEGFKFPDTWNNQPPMSQELENASYPN